MTYSDNREDDYILSLFPEGYEGTAVEVGAGDGQTLSNTLLLEQSGWNVLCVEPNPDLAEDLKKIRKNVVLCACLAHSGEEDFYSYANPGGAHREVVATVGDLDEDFRARFCSLASREPVIRKVRVAMLNSLLEEWPHQDPIDFISIDVDGREVEVLNGFNLERYSPRYMLIEDVVERVRPTDVEKYMRGHGYFRVGTFGWNGLWSSQQNQKERFETQPGHWALRREDG
jgi:FkbM family methyltransferase